MKKLFVRTLVLIVAVFLAAGSAKTNAMEAGDKARDFSLTDLNGNKVSISDFNGKVVILDFFASWCPPCRQEVPDFIKLQNEYGTKGFSVIGVALVKLQDAKAFASQAGINYPVLIDDGKVSTLYGPVRSIPTTFVIGKDSKIAKVYIGFRPKEVFEKDIQELLK